MKKKLLIMYLKIINQIRVIISIFREFLSIPTTPEYILKILKIKTIQIFFLIGTVILVLYPLRGIWLPFLVLIFNHLNINLEPLALFLINAEIENNRVFDILFYYLKYLLKILSPFKCYFGIKVLLNKKIFSSPSVSAPSPLMLGEGQETKNKIK